MKRNLFVIFMCLCVMFAFASCGNSSSDENSADKTTGVKLDLEATDTDTPATNGFTKVKQGEEFTLDWGEFTIGAINHGDYLESKSGIQYYPSNDNDYLWLPIDFTNTSSDPIDFGGWNILCNFIINDEYNYEGGEKQIDGDWVIQPLETRTLYVLAEVPANVADSYETITIQFSFNDYFTDYNVFDDEITDLDYVYEVKASK